MESKPCVVEWHAPLLKAGLRFTASMVRPSEVEKHHIDVVKWTNSIRKSEALADKLNQLDPLPPNKIYHIYHVCFCTKCGNGQVFSHSQGSWNGHLKTVDNSQIVDLSC